MTGVGIDLVQVSRIAESVHRFGDRFLRRVFTEAEIAYATSSPTQCAPRLAARFAAKEATIKALRVEPNTPIAWRDIEVQRTPSGSCELALHGTAARWAKHRGSPSLSVSLSHDGDYATAIVVSR
ncbi:MAG: holo-ACP synthase [Gemmatimonadaceae bacterium]